MKTRREGVFKIRGGDGVGVLWYLLEMDAHNRKRKEGELGRRWTMPAWQSLHQPQQGFWTKISTFYQLKWPYLFTLTFLHIWAATGRCNREQDGSLHFGQVLKELMLEAGSWLYTHSWLHVPSQKEMSLYLHVCHWNIQTVPPEIWEL